MAKMKCHDIEIKNISDKCSGIAQETGNIYIEFNSYCIKHLLSLTEDKGIYKKKEYVKLVDSMENYFKHNEKSKPLFPCAGVYDNSNADEPIFFIDRGILGKKIKFCIKEIDKKNTLEKITGKVRKTFNKIAHFCDSKGACKENKIPDYEVIYTKHDNCTKDFGVLLNENVINAISSCLDIVEKNDQYKNDPGLYRVEGSKDKLNQAIKDINSGSTINEVCAKQNDPSILTNLLKRLGKEMLELKLDDFRNDEKKVCETKECLAKGLAKMNSDKRKLLCRYLENFSNLIANNQKNLMRPDSISISVKQFWSHEGLSALEEVSLVSYENAIMELLIDNQKNLCSPL